MLTVWLVGISHAVIAQEPVFRARLGVMINFLEPSHGKRDIQGQALILRGVPFEMDVSVNNPFEGFPGGAEADWPSRLTLRMWRGDIFSESTGAAEIQCADSSSLLSGPAETLGDHILVADGQQIYRCGVEGLLEHLEAGPYTVSAAWNPLLISGSPFKESRESRHNYVFEFELRNIETIDDQIDRDIALAHRALFTDRDPHEAVEFIEAILLRDPFNAEAFFMRARARARLDDCAGAKTDWRAAIDLIEQGVGRGDVARLGAAERQELAAKRRYATFELRCP